MSETAFAVTSLDGVFLSVDQSFCEVTQRDRADLLGRTILDVTLCRDRADNGAKLDLLRTTGQPFTIQKHYIGEDGRLIAVRNDVSMLRSEADAPRLVANVHALRGDRSAPPGPRDLLNVANALVGERRLRSSRLDRRWRSGTAWEIVLATYISEMEGRACLAEEVTSSVDALPGAILHALRGLADEGVLSLEDHVLDGAPRHIIRLTAETVGALEDHLTTLCG